MRFFIADYDAPLSEAGDYTEKYQIAKDLIAADTKVPTLTPEMPAANPKTAYPAAPISEFLTYDQIIAQVVRLKQFHLDLKFNDRALNLFRSLQM